MACGASSLRGWVPEGRMERGRLGCALRGRGEARPHAAELGGVLGRGLGEEGGGGRVR